MTTVEVAPDASAALGLHTHLAANLPGLSDEDLQDLTLEVRSQLELRIGAALSDGLTDAQLEEFDELVESGDQEACFAWLAANRPHYRAAVVTERSRLIAEVVSTVAAADPSAATGERRFDETFSPSMELIVDELSSLDAAFVCEPDGGVRVDCEATAKNPQLLIRIRQMVSAPGLFVFTGISPPVILRAECEAMMAAFAADWNRRTWLPKASVMDGGGADRCCIVGEIAVPAEAPITRAHMNSTVRRCFSSMFALFRDAHAVLLEREAGNIGD